MMIARGSLLAGAAQATNWQGFGQSVVGLAGIFLFQYLAAIDRCQSKIAEFVLQNERVILMKDGQLVKEAIKKTRVEANDV